MKTGTTSMMNRTLVDHLLSNLWCRELATKFRKARDSEFPSCLIPTRFRSVLYTIMLEDLEYKELFSRSVPKLLVRNPNRKDLARASIFLIRDNVKRDEILVYHGTSASRQFNVSQGESKRNTFKA
ncbi:hypothetical protein Trydic_g1330 [Trypoxylus dichotomus]